MFFRNFKITARLVAVMFILGFAGATICLAKNVHSCCADNHHACPQVALQSVPKTVQSKYINPGQNDLVLYRQDSLPEVGPVKPRHLAETFTPEYRLRQLISLNLPHAPPLPA